MAATEIKVQMQQRRDTAAGWTSAGVVLLAGELGYETDTGHAKLGDGTTAWASLAYLPSAGKVKDGTVSAPGLAFASDLNTGIFRPGADQLNISTNGVERLSIGNSEFVVNDPSNDVDFRVESNGNTHMLFVDAGNDGVTIGTSSAATSSQLTIGATNPNLTLQASTSSSSIINLGDTDAYNIGRIKYDNSNNSLQFDANNSQRMIIDSSGNLGLGTSSPTETLTLNTPSGASIGFEHNGTEIATINNNAAALYVHAGSGKLLSLGAGGSESMRIDSSGKLGVGTSSPSAHVESEGDVSSTTQFSGFQGLRVQNANGSAFGVTADINFVAGTSSGNRGAAIGVEYMSGSKNDLYFATSGGSVTSTDTLTERMRIDSSGRVAIGTTTIADAATALVIKNTASGSEHTFIDIVCNTNETARVRFSEDGSSFPGEIKYDTLNNFLSFNTNSSERVRVDSSGNVFIGGTNAATADIALNANGEIIGKNQILINRVDAGSYILEGQNNGTQTSLITKTGNATFAGALSKGSGSFKISHPLPAKTETHHLIHSFIEGPQADLIYRGYVDLVDGQATVNIDTAGRMSEGTFEVLCTNVSCFTSNESDWTAVKGSVTGNVLTIAAQDATATSKVSWMVVGERKDQHMIDTEWTDAVGRVITEPEKVVEAVEETEE